MSELHEGAAVPKSETQDPNRPFRLLIAEDDDEIRWCLVDLFAQRGFELHAVPNGVELLDYLASSILLDRSKPAPDVIISDIRMPGMNGLGILEGLRGAGWMTPVILVTAFGDGETRSRAMRIGATGFFDKPLDLPELREAVVRAAITERSKPIHERRALPAVEEHTVGEDAVRMLREEELRQAVVLRESGGSWEAIGVISSSARPTHALEAGAICAPWRNRGTLLERLLGRLERKEIAQLFAVVRPGEGAPILARVGRARPVSAPVPSRAPVRS
jgi:CheY-like chemotaxis protein